MPGEALSLQWNPGIKYNIILIAILCNTFNIFFDYRDCNLQMWSVIISQGVEIDSWTLQCVFDTVSRDKVSQWLAVRRWYFPFIPDSTTTSAYSKINLIKIEFFLYISKILFFGDTLTSDNITFGVMSNDLSLNVDRPITNKTGKHVKIGNQLLECIRI